MTRTRYMEMLSNSKIIKLVIKYALFLCLTTSDDVYMLCVYVWRFL